MRRTRGALEAARRENLRTDMQAQPGEFNRAAEPIASIFRSVCSYPELSDAGMGADPSVSRTVAAILRYPVRRGRRCGPSVDG
jgi:hypothetical protein